jgi:hypothetical protein
MAASEKTWRPWRLALIAAMGIAAAVGSVAQVPRTVTLLVFNLGQIPDELLAQAEKDSLRILAEARVSMVAINCRAEPLDMAHPNHCQRVDATTFLLRVESQRAADRSPDMLGYSLLFHDSEGASPAAGVFYPAARDLADKSGAGIHQVLGAAIAHEVCHLLIGERHSAKGIMRAHWGREELGRVRIGELLFSKDEAARMQAVLARPVEKVPLGSAESFKNSRRQ